MSSDYRKKNDDTEIDMSGIIIEDNDVKVTERADTNLSHTAKLQEDSSEDVFEQAAKDADRVNEDENHPEGNVRRKKREVHGKKRKVMQWIGWGVAIVQVILSVVLMVQVGALGMIPEKYLVYSGWAYCGIDIFWQDDNSGMDFWCIDYYYCDFWLRLFRKNTVGA